MERRPSYRATKSDYYTHANDLPPQVGARAVDEKTNGERAAGQVDKRL
jgi:glutathione S-transferase